MSRFGNYLDNMYERNDYERRANVEKVKMMKYENKMKSENCVSAYGAYTSASRRGDEVSKSIAYNDMHRNIYY